MVMGAFKSNAEIFASPWALPEVFNYQNFIQAWTDYNIGTSFFNSLIVTVFGALLTLLLAVPTSYALERVRFRGSTFLYNVYLAAMMIPMVLGWIPLFFLLMNFNLLNSLIGLILVYAVSQVPFSVFILTGFMGTIPSELEESAAIDGLSPFGDTVAHRHPAHGIGNYYGDDYERHYVLERVLYGAHFPPIPRKIHTRLGHGLHQLGGSVHERVGNAVCRAHDFNYSGHHRVRCLSTAH